VIDTSRHFSDDSRYSSCAPDRLWDEDEDNQEDKDADRADFILDERREREMLDD
jgi:hypothetical protein